MRMLGGVLVYAAAMAAGAAWADDDLMSDGAAVQAVPVSASVEISASGGSVDVVPHHGAVAVAPTAAEAEAAYQAARKGFMAVASGGPASAPGDVDQNVKLKDEHIAGGKPSNIALEDIQLVMDLDNVTLREVMVKIVGEAARYTGPWTVKWRLKPENADLLDERVNLTAEAKFGDFCDLLTERVKNMTGTQLFVTAFGGSRVLLVTDTYY